MLIQLLYDCPTFTLLFYPVQDCWIRLVIGYFRRKVLYYKVLLKVSEKSLKNICDGVSLDLQPY